MCYCTQPSLQHCQRNPFSAGRGLYAYRRYQEAFVFSPYALLRGSAQQENETQESVYVKDGGPKTVTRTQISAGHMTTIYDGIRDSAPIRLMREKMQSLTDTANRMYEEKITPSY